MSKVKIKKLPLPKAAGGGNYGTHAPPSTAIANPYNGSYLGGNTPEIKVRETIEPTSRENATLEAELGETLITNLQGEGIPEFYKIGGKRHSRGGTPLNVPANSFIFSRDNKLKIGDKEVLSMFGKTNGKKYTPAEVSKQYNLNKYREILVNPYTDKLQRETAEKMIQNYNLKLGALSLVQESMKGFETGIPAVAIGYLEHAKINPAELMGGSSQQQSPQPQMRYGGEILPKFQKGGGVTKLGRGERMVKDEDGNILIVNKRGDVVGRMNQGAPRTSSRPTAKQNIPKDGIFWDPKSDNYERSRVRAGHYYKNPDTGRWEKVTGFGPKAVDKDSPYYDGDPALGGMGQSYSLLKQTFGENPELQEAFVTNYREAMKEAKPGKHLTAEDIALAQDMSADEIMENFYAKEKQNFALAEKLGTIEDPEDLMDKDPAVVQKMLRDMDMEPMDPAHVAAFQAAYIGLDKLSKDPKYKKDLQDFKIHRGGIGDEGDTSGTGEAAISSIDGFEGNTTIGQAALAVDSEMAVEDVENKKSPAEAKHLAKQVAADPAQFWTQDLVNIAGNVTDLYSIKKATPWQAPLPFETATPHFMDFRGQAARIGSQSAAGAKQAATFASPQSYAANFANIQKGAMPGILQTQEAEYRGNQAIANQFEMFNTQAKNRHNVRKQGLDTKLWDKSVIVNQQFDNAKRDARAKLRGSINNAWTNRGKTQTMNSLRDDFAVDPRTGFTQKKNTHPDFLPSNGNQQSIVDIAAGYKEQYPDLEWDTALKYAAQAQGGAPAVGANIDGLAYPPTR